MRGGKVTLTDIDAARAAALARDLGAAAIPPEALDDCPATILVNATPVGMTPDVDGIPINPDLLGRFEVVMDIVYQPLTHPAAPGSRRPGAAPPSTACRCSSTRPRRSLSCSPAGGPHGDHGPGGLRGFGSEAVGAGFKPAPTIGLKKCRAGTARLL